MYCLKKVDKKFLYFCFDLRRHSCSRKEYFVCPTRRKVQIFEVSKKQVDFPFLLAEIIKKNNLNSKQNILYTVQFNPRCNFVNVINDLSKKNSQLDMRLSNNYHTSFNKTSQTYVTNVLYERGTMNLSRGLNKILYKRQSIHPCSGLFSEARIANVKTKRPLEYNKNNSETLEKNYVISSSTMFSSVLKRYSYIQTRHLHIFSTNYIRNIKSMKDLDTIDSRENNEIENCSTHNSKIHKLLLKRKLDKGVSNDEHVIINPKLLEKPKNTLHNFFNILSRELNTNFEVSPSYLLHHNQWHCTYNLKWPEPVKISKHAFTKKEASYKAAIAALTWLKQHRKITPNGQPLVFDQTNSKSISEKNRKILQLDDFTLSKLNLIYEKYNSNFLKDLDFNRSSGEKTQNTDIALEDPWPMKNRIQQILQLDNYTAKEDINLPIQAYRNDIIDLVNDNRITIIKGEPGCGKSIRVPQYILEGWSKTGALEEKPCKIVVTQPRRIAAVSLAERVSFERQEEVGNIVGYQVRFKTNFNNRKGRILYCTSGILLRQLQTDPTLCDCTHIILDEAHERDVNSDLLMNLLQYALKLNPELKLIVMSATIDTNVFQQYFKDSSVFHVPGITYPVKEHFIDKCKTVNYAKTLKMCESNEPHVIIDDVVNTIKYIHSTKPEGAVLCFLPGWEDISKVAKALPSTSDMIVLCLHSKLDISEQKKVFSKPPPGVRKVILSTNIAETSITINDIVYVIDTGIEKQSRFDAEKGVNCVDQSWISQANVKQRIGRAGRVQPGESFHLYTKKKMEDFVAYPIPEILRTSLVKIVLDSKVYSGNMSAIEFLSHLPTPPNDNAIMQAVNELIDLDLLEENENLTPLGRTLSNFQMEPKLAKTIANAVIFQCVTPIISIVSLFAEETNIFASILANKNDIKKVKSEFSSTSDHLAMMKIFEKWLEYIEAWDKEMANEFCIDHNLVYFKMNSVQKLREMYFDYVFKCFNEEILIGDDFSDNDELVKAVLLSDGGYLLKLNNFEKVKGRLKKNNVLLNRNNHKVKITPESVNSSRTEFPSDFIMYINETRSNIRRTTIVRETSFISLLPLLLFKNEDLVLRELQTPEYATELQSNDQVILALDKANIQCICDRSHGEAIVKCKEVLNAGKSYYSYMLATKNSTNFPINKQWKEILMIVNSLLLSYKT